MEFLIFWIFIHLTLTCQSQNTNVRHLSMKMNRLSRITDGLQKDVSDIWTVISSSGIESQKFGNRTRLDTDEMGRKDKGTLAELNGTVTEVTELKTEVENLVLYSRIGFMNEKRFQREEISDLRKSYQVFQTGLKEENNEMSYHIERLHTENTDMKHSIKRLDTEVLDLQEKSKNNLLRIKTNNRNLTERVIENDQSTEDIDTRLDSVNKVLENLAAMQSRLELENQELKQKMSDMQRELAKVRATARLITCDDGWSRFHGNCYLFISQKKTWHDALATCESRNSYLVEIITESELEFVAQLGKLTTNVLRIGATDLLRGHEGDFVYQESHREVSHKFWGDGEPNNHGGEEHCVEMFNRRGDGKFNDVPCTFKWKFVCEKQLTPTA